MWKVIVKFFAAIGFVNDPEEEARHAAFLDKLDKEQEEDSMYADEQKRREKAKMFLDNLQRAEINAQNKKLLTKRNTNSIVIAKAMERQEETKQKHTKLF